eukprot:gnl/TRDRNA2_/TRDRNA2_167145_c0_seq10.p1 gnl/TRDRNA2_/TRDRNA2_167145_c0~~gnl/TRDRNA2_/TRDRNA2_167145_c0_seq10.p1  ORF type:complete len:232 (+),score=43.82 gnl/TRDRNA2_/TRDRNA2_167145_c0_seq10:64-759(+)
MTTIDFFDEMNLVHLTMPGQAMLAAVLGKVCGCTHSVSHDTSEMFLVTLYTFVGWYIMSRMLRSLRFAPATKATDTCLFDLDYSDDELEEVEYEEESLLECHQLSSRSSSFSSSSSGIAPGRHQSPDLVPLEQHFAFGAEPASWTLPCIEQEKPKRGVAKRNLGMAPLENYGVFDAAPSMGVALLDHFSVFDATWAWQCLNTGVWEYPKDESKDNRQCAEFRKPNNPQDFS